MKHTSIFLLAIVVFISACIGASQQNANQDNQEIPANAQPLTSCGKIEGNSYLENDIDAKSLKALEACFEVAQDNIILDCKDRSIEGWVQRAEGTGTKGLVGSGIAGLKIRNCVFKSHFMGIDLTGEDIEVTNSRFEVNSIGLNGDYVNSIFKSNEFHNSSNAGLWLDKSKNNRVENSVFMKNAKSLILKDSSNNVVFNNQMDGEISKTAGSTGYGIWLLRSDDNTVDSNTIVKYYYGMTVQGSSRNKIARNTIRSNLNTGLHLISDRNLQAQFSDLINSADNVIEENTIEKSLVSGVYLENIIDAKNSFNSNRLCDNNQYDFNCKSTVTIEGSGNTMTKTYKSSNCVVPADFSKVC